MKFIVIIFLITSIFFGIILPFFLAPFGFYNGLPGMTTFVPISLVLSIGLAIAGIFYHFYEKKLVKIGKI
ncbi:MAG: hypothetical protein ACREAE_10485 [Nitrosopumilaceae archaeon]